MNNNGFYDVELSFDDVMDGGTLSEVFYLKELQKRRLYLNGDIDQYSVEDIKKHILQFNREDFGLDTSSREPIVLYINSNGGEIDAGFGLIDTIMMSKTPVYTVNIGFQYSMGFLIGIAGHKRFASPSAKFLLHDGTDFAYNSGAKVRDQFEFGIKVSKRIKEYVISRSKITEDEYDSKFRVEWYMFADEAKQNGFTDFIIGVDCDIDAIL